MWLYIREYSANLRHKRSLGAIVTPMECGKRGGYGFW